MPLSCWQGASCHNFVINSASSLVPSRLESPFQSLSAAPQCASLALLKLSWPVEQRPHHCCSCRKHPHAVDECEWWCMGHRQHHCPALTLTGTTVLSIGLQSSPPPLVHRRKRAFKFTLDHWNGQEHHHQPDHRPPFPWRHQHPNDHCLLHHQRHRQRQCNPRPSPHRLLHCPTRKSAPACRSTAMYSALRVWDRAAPLLPAASLDPPR